MNYRILDHNGRAMRPLVEGEMCDHGIVFDIDEARRILGDWSPSTPHEFVLGNPRHSDVRKRFPRLNGPCPLGCGFSGIGYASAEHYAYGDW